jgi:hypothetical protein
MRSVLRGTAFATFARLLSSRREGNRKEDVMSAQTLPIRTRPTFATWRYAVAAVIVAIVLALALVVADGGSARQQAPAASTIRTTFQVPGGIARGHPLP